MCTCECFVLNKCGLVWTKCRVEFVTNRNENKIAHKFLLMKQILKNADIFACTETFTHSFFNMLSLKFA